MSPDNNYFLTKTNNTLFIWDLNSQKRISTYKGNYSNIVSGDISTNNHYFVSGSSDKSLKIWELDKYKSIYLLYRKIGYNETDSYKVTANICYNLERYEEAAYNYKKAGDLLMTKECLNKAAHNLVLHEKFDKAAIFYEESGEKEKAKDCIEKAENKKCLESKNMARIYFKRHWNIFGAIVDHIIIDKGDGVEKDIIVCQNKYFNTEDANFDLTWNVPCMYYTPYKECAIHFFGTPYHHIANNPFYTGYFNYPFVAEIIKYENYEVRQNLDNGNIAIILNKSELSSNDFKLLKSRNFDIKLNNINNDITAKVKFPDLKDELKKHNIEFIEQPYSGYLSIINPETKKERFSINPNTIRMYFEGEIVSNAYWVLSSLSDRVSVGETVFWDRPPGYMRIEVITPGGDQAFAPFFKVEAGKQYMIEYYYMKSDFNIYEIDESLNEIFEEKVK